jgi:hypothetical protein
MQAKLLMKLRPSSEILFVLVSILIQVPLAVFLGHYYDDRVFMATGYLVNSGFNPYLQYNFANVFPPAIISGYIPSIGYPPLWPILLGLIYKLSFAVTQNIFLYNFAIKIPIIAANIALAYLVRHILVDFQVSKKRVQTAFLLIVFNPFILLSTTAWGAFDTLIATLCLASIYLLSKGKIAACAFLLGFATALKPISLPLAPLPLFFSSAALTRKRKLQYCSIFTLTLAACYFGPFIIEGWKIPLAQNQLTAQVQMAGGMTLFNVAEIFQSLPALPQTLSFLSYIWIPALAIVYYALYRVPPRDLKGLIEKAIPVLLIFFVSRTWVSEPNINLLLPLMLIVGSYGGLRLREFHFAWIIPLVFMFPNYAFPQLFFLVNPSIMASLQTFDAQFGLARVIAQFLVVVVWTIFAFKIIAEMLPQRKEKTHSPLLN